MTRDSQPARLPLETLEPISRQCKEFSHSNGRPYSLPKIMGLTASPSENGKSKKLRDLEANLSAICKTPRKCRAELRQHVHCPKLQRLEYDVSDIVWLEHAVDPDRHEILCHEDEKFLVMVMKVRAKVIHVASELGIWAALTFVEDLIVVLQRRGGGEISAPFKSSAYHDGLLIQHLRPALERLTRSMEEKKHTSSEQCHTSSKVRCLMRCLHQVYMEKGEAFIGIIFVRQRVAAAMLSRLLERHTASANCFRVGVFVGESNSASYAKEPSELVVPRTQNHALRDFRRGRINLMIATDALDEGIDVAECNTIVCFDPPQNLRSFVQKRGRARKKASTYMIMVPKEGTETASDGFESLEKLMLQQVQQDQQEAQAAEDMEVNDEEVQYSLRSSKTGAYVTAQKTRAHLEHFCNKLPQVPYTETRPTFSFKEDAAGKITAQVQLPMSVPPGVRVAISEKSWCTERAAARDAAFQAYKGLYDYGLLTEHLVPLKDESNFDEDFQDQRRGFFQSSERLFVWDDYNGKGVPDHLFRSSLTFRGGSVGIYPAELAIWTRRRLPRIPDLSLLAEHGQALTIQCEASFLVEGIGEDSIRKLSSCTQTLLKSIRSSDQAEPENDFIVFVTPDIELDSLDSWLESHTGEMPARSFYDLSDRKAAGLVVNRILGRSLYVFEAWQRMPDRGSEDTNATLEVECVPFSKRRNFLKTKSTHIDLSDHDRLCEEQLGTDAIRFNAEDCAIKLQPVDIAWAMRLIPSIFFQMEMILIGHRLIQDVLPFMRIKDVPDICRSITSPSTGLCDNYDRLEFLGDSVLKFHVTQQLYCDYPHWHEEFLTRKRNTIISNVSLAKAAVRMGLDKFVIKEPFVGKNWTVPFDRSVVQRAASERQLSLKLLADVVEALIGAAFQGNGMTSAALCMATLVSEVREKVDFALCTQVFTSLRPIENCSSRLLAYAQHFIRYGFSHPRTLLEALTHPSCTRDLLTEPYQRLEFLGDAILDHIVVTDLFEMLPNASQALLTKIRSALVNSDLLAFLSFSLDEVIEDVSYTGDRDNPKVRLRHERHRGLWMMMRYGLGGVEDARDDAFDRFQALRASITGSLASGKRYPWEELCMMRSPKFVSDVIESILGAIFVDSNKDLAACRAFLEHIGLLRYLRGVVRNQTDVSHPKETLNRLLCGRKIEHVWDVSSSMEMARSFSLSMCVDGVQIASVAGCATRREADLCATNVACRHLEGT